MRTTGPKTVKDMIGQQMQVGDEVVFHEVLLRESDLKIDHAPLNYATIIDIEDKHPFEVIVVHVTQGDYRPNRLGSQLGILAQNVTKVNNKAEQIIVNYSLESFEEDEGNKFNPEEI